MNGLNVNDFPIGNGAPPLKDSNGKRLVNEWVDQRSRIYQEAYRNVSRRVDDQITIPSRFDIVTEVMVLFAETGGSFKKRGRDGNWGSVSDEEAREKVAKLFSARQRQRIKKQTTMQQARPESREIANYLQSSEVALSDGEIISQRAVGAESTFHEESTGTCREKVATTTRVEVDDDNVSTVKQLHTSIDGVNNENDEGKLNPDYIGMGQKQIRDGVYPQIVEDGLISELERIKEAGEPWPEKVEQLKIARKIARDLEIDGFGGTYAWLNGVAERRKICGPTAKTIDSDDLKVATLDQKNNHVGAVGAALVERTHNTTGDNPMIARGIDVLQMQKGSFCNARDNGRSLHIEDISLLENSGKQRDAEAHAHQPHNKNLAKAPEHGSWKIVESVDVIPTPPSVGVDNDETLDHELDTFRQLSISEFTGEERTAPSVGSSPHFSQSSRSTSTRGTATVWGLLGVSLPSTDSVDASSLTLSEEYLRQGHRSFRNKKSIRIISKANSMQPLAKKMRYALSTVWKGSSFTTQSLLPPEYQELETQWLQGNSPPAHSSAVWIGGRYVLTRYHCTQTLEGQSNDVRCCAVWNDGRHLLSGSRDKTLKVWERTSDGQYHCIQTLEGHSLGVSCCAVWNDGQHLLSGCWDGTLKVWERTSDGQYHCIQTLKGHSSDVYCCTVWNDGQHLLSGSCDKTLKVWERASDGQYHCIQTLEGHSDSVHCCAVWNGGQHLLSGSRDDILKVWERASDGQYHCIQTLKGHYSFVYCCAVWNDGQHLLSGSLELKVWQRASDGQYHCIQTLKGHCSFVYCCAVWNDGQHLLSGSLELKVWQRANDGQYHCIQTLEDHLLIVECCAVWNGGQYLLSGSADKILKVWERASNGQYHCIQTLKGHSDWVHCCAVSSDGRHLLSGNDVHILKVWSLEAGQEDETEPN